MDGLKSTKNPKTLVATGPKKGDVGWWVAKSRLVLLKLAGILHSKDDKCVINRGGNEQGARSSSGVSTGDNQQWGSEGKKGEKKHLLGQGCSRGKAIHIQGLPQKGQDDGFNLQICQKNTLRDTEKVIKRHTGVHKYKEDIHQQIMRGKSCILFKNIAQ